MSDTFAVIGVDFAGPVYSRLKKSVTAKAYQHQRSTPEAVSDFSSAEFQRA